MKLILQCLLWSISLTSYAQIDPSDSSRFNFSFSTGITLPTFKDQNISSQPYSGTITPYVFNWQHNRPGHTWNLIIDYATGTVNNYNLNTKLDDISIQWKYTYAIKELRLFNRPALLSGGLSPNLWIYYRKQNLAEPNLFLYSAKLLANMNIHTGLNGALAPKTNYRLTTSFNLLSYGISTEVNEDNLETTGKLSTVFSTPLIHWSLSVDQKLTRWLSIGAGYAFRYYKHERLTFAADAFTGKISATF